MNQRLFNWFVKRVSFNLVARYNGLGRLSSNIAFMEQSQFWPPERILEFQMGQLKKLLIHAGASTKYYKRMFSECNFNPKSFKSLDDLRKLPLLSKNDIRSNLSDMLSTKFSTNELHASETGGTTGVKMKFFLDKNCFNIKEASLYRFEKWSGWAIGERMGLVWPAQQDYVGHWTWKAKLKNELFNRQVVFPAAVLDDQVIEKYINLIKIKKPSMIRAFSSPIYEVAIYILKHNIHLHDIKGIITTGEPLYPSQRKMISQAFNCSVFDSYRCREVGPIAQECSCHDGLHINAENMIVEILPCEDLKTTSSCPGEIVITDLLNYGMPFIRYRMGDLAQLDNRPCECGRGLPRLYNIQGRTADLFYSPQGKRIAAGSLVLYLVDEAPGSLGQVQIVQDCIDHITIRLTTDPYPSDQLMEYQKETVKRLFGGDMQVDFDIVENIPREDSGKFRFTKCLIKDNAQNRKQAI